MNTQQSDDTRTSDNPIDVDLLCLENKNQPINNTTGMEMQAAYMETSAAIASTSAAALIQPDSQQSGDLAFSRSPTNYLLNQRIGDLCVSKADDDHPMEQLIMTPLSPLATPISTEEHLLHVIQIKSSRIHELEEAVRKKDIEIAELKSHLDKFQSVFPFSNRGRKTGVHGASGQRQRAQGISAEPQNETSVLALDVTFPKYDKDDR